MRKLATKLFVVVVSLSYLYAQSPCPQGINLLPMYGKAKKCREQLALDKQFLDECDRKFASRQLASVASVKFGWKYFYDNQLDVAIKRFNQAWLLDSANAEVYWGFASVLGMKQQYRESIPLFQKYLASHPTEANAWEGLSTSYGQLFFQTKDIELLYSDINALKNCIKLNPKNARASGQLTGAYSYFVQKDSARRYLRITDALNPDAVNPKVRAMLTK